MSEHGLLSHRATLHLKDGLREVVDTADVYLLEAEGGQTMVRLRDADPREDVRPLGEILPHFEARGFLRIHRSYAVNLSRVQFLRRRDVGRDWEVRLEPPVNRVLPVSRDALPYLLEALEGGG